MSKHLTRSPNAQIWPNPYGKLSSQHQPNSCLIPKLVGNNVFERELGISYMGAAIDFGSLYFRHCVLVIRLITKCQYAVLSDPFSRWLLTFLLYGPLKRGNHFCFRYSEPSMMSSNLFSNYSFSFLLSISFKVDFGNRGVPHMIHEPFSCSPISHISQTITLLFCESV
jgi:hypothetical protein